MDKTAADALETDVIVINEENHLNADIRKNSKTATDARKKGNTE